MLLENKKGRKVTKSQNDGHYEHILTAAVRIFEFDS